MNRIILAMLVPGLLAAQTYKAKYEGGTLHDVKRGAQLVLVVSRDAVVVGALPVAASAFTYVGESQDAGHAFPSIPLYGVGVVGGMLGGSALSALTSLHTVRRYVGLKWDRESVVLQAGSDWRGMVADIEASTGLRSGVVRRDPR